MGPGTGFFGILRKLRMTTWLAQRFLRRERMAQITISRWGKKLAIRFPGEIVKALGLREGERLEVESKDGDIFIHRAIPHFSLEEMFRGKSPKKWRANYADAYDCGPDVGRELIEE
jgi:antitoxin component of MazEF toxin-antitoxin module